MESNNKLVIILMGIIIFILGALCILFATETISFTKDSDSKEQEVVKEEEKLPEWISYILKQDITEITYESGKPIDGSGVLTCEEAKTMTKEQLKNVLLKMSESPITKFDLEDAGGPCWGGIKVKYGNKVFNIYLGNVVITANNDTAVVALLDKENYTLDETTNSTPNWAYEFDWDESYIESLLK